jgi:hypothetical protein
MALGRKEPGVKGHDRWIVTRAVGEKFAAMRAAHLKYRKDLARARVDYRREPRGGILHREAMDALDYFEVRRRRVRLSTGDTLILSDGELLVLETLGPVLGPEEAALLRVLTERRHWQNPNEGALMTFILGLRRDGVPGEEIDRLSAPYKKKPDRWWNEELATKIDKAGGLEVVGVE